VRLFALVCTFVFAAFPVSLSASEPDAVKTYRTVDDQALDAHIFAPEQDDSAAPAILLFHGGGWRFGSPAWVFRTAELFADNGAVAIAIQYRLSVDGVTPADAFDDVCAAFAWVRAHSAELGVDAERIGAYGVSAGGHLAALTGSKGCADAPRPNALVLYSPAIKTSQDGWFQRLMGEPEDKTAYSPVEQAGKDTPPTLIINGDADTLTPLPYAREYCEALQPMDTACRVMVFKGVGHLLTRNLDNQESNFDAAPEDIERARDAIVAFFREQGLLADD